MVFFTDRQIAALYTLCTVYHILFYVVYSWTLDHLAAHLSSNRHYGRVV